MVYSRKENSIKIAPKGKESSWGRLHDKNWIQERKTISNLSGGKINVAHLTTSHLAVASAIQKYTEELEIKQTGLNSQKNCYSCKDQTSWVSIPKISSTDYIHTMIYIITSV